MDSQILVFPAGVSAPILNAAKYLKEQDVNLIDHPSPDVTHLLLDVPSFQDNGLLKNGCEIYKYTEMLPANITLIGGGFPRNITEHFRTIDLLSNPEYLCRNAAITAQCLLRLAADNLITSFADTKTVLIGWGRIGKVLARYLKALDAPLTVCVRSESDLALLHALGYNADYIVHIPTYLPAASLVINTVPNCVIPRSVAETCKDSVMIDLASSPGIDTNNVIWARGLPAKFAPASSGKLIAQIIYPLLRKVDSN